MDYNGIDFDSLRRSQVPVGRKTYDTLSACLVAMHNCAVKERVVACRWVWSFWVTSSVSFSSFRYFSKLRRLKANVLSHERRLAMCIIFGDRF